MLNMAEDHDDEERWVALGIDALGRILAVIYTFRGESIRMISARPATQRESRQYLEKQ